MAELWLAMKSHARPRRGKILELYNESLKTLNAKINSKSCAMFQFDMYEMVQIGNKIE